MLAFASLVSAAAYFPPSDINLPTLFAAFVGCTVGSLIPDMDQGSNRLWDLLPGGDFVGRVFRRVFLGHRSLSHSLLGLYIFYRLMDWFLPRLLNTPFIDPQVLLWSVMIGLVSHVAADGLTEEGIPLFFPFGFKVGFPPFRRWRIKTGGWFENLVIFPGTLAYLFFFIHGHQNQLLGLLRLVTG